MSLRIAPLILAFALLGCSDRRSASDENKVIAGETYKEYVQRRDSLNGSRGEFAGQDCTEDCSGHKAGYAWAEKKVVTDPDNCDGKSWSFIEGCRAYAEQASSEGWYVQTTRRCEATYRSNGFPSVADCLKSAIDDAEAEERIERQAEYDPRG